MLSQLAKWLGAPGGVVILIMIAAGVYHFRRALAAGAMLAFGLKIFMAIVVVVGIGASGLVPGFSVTINLQEIAPFLNQGLDLLPDVIP